MKRLSQSALLFSALIASACGEDSEELLSNLTDASIIISVDASIPGDPSLPDVGLSDLGIPDIPDTGIPDIDMPDLSIPDISIPDLGIPDISIPDLSIPDIGLPGLADIGIGTPDAGNIDLDGGFGALECNSEEFFTMGTSTYREAVSSVTIGGVATCDPYISAQAVRTPVSDVTTFSVLTDLQPGSLQWDVSRISLTFLVALKSEYNDLSLGNTDVLVSINSRISEGNICLVTGGTISLTEIPSQASPRISGTYNFTEVSSNGVAEPECSPVSGEFSGVIENPEVL